MAILQGGTTTPDESPDLVSLGTIFYEPLWLFVPESFNGKSVEAFFSGLETGFLGNLFWKGKMVKRLNAYQTTCRCPAGAP